MSVIDKRGKLFGKLNIIDLIAIVIIVAVAILLCVKLIGNRSGGLNGNGVSVVYTVKVPGVQAEVYEAIQKELPSQLMASGEMLNGYVTQVTGTTSTDNMFSLSTYQDSNTAIISQVAAGTYDLVFTIEATLDEAVNHELGTQEVRIGKSHIIKTVDFELANGVILTCEDAAPAADPAQPADSAQAAQS